MSSTSTVGGQLKTAATLQTEDGKQINLGVLDNRAGIRMDFFGKHIDLTYPWTPSLWWYKYITYTRRIKLMNKEK